MASSVNKDILTCDECTKMSRTLASSVSRVISAGHLSAAALAALGISLQQGSGFNDFGLTFVTYGGTAAMACAVGEALMPVVEGFIGEGSERKDMMTLRKRLMQSVVSGAVAEGILMAAGVSSPSLSVDTAVETLILGSSCWAGPMVAQQLPMA